MDDLDLNNPIDAALLPYIKQMHFDKQIEEALKAFPEESDRSTLVFEPGEDYDSLMIKSLDYNPLLETQLREEDISHLDCTTERVANIAYISEPKFLLIEQEDGALVPYNEEADFDDDFF